MYDWYHSGVSGDATGEREPKHVMVTTQQKTWSETPFLGHIEDYSCSLACMEGVGASIPTEHPGCTYIRHWASEYGLRLILLLVVWRPGSALGLNCRPIRSNRKESQACLGLPDVSVGRYKYD